MKADPLCLYVLVSISAYVCTTAVHRIIECRVRWYVLTLALYTCTYICFASVFILSVRTYVLLRNATLLHFVFCSSSACSPTEQWTLLTLIFQLASHGILLLLLYIVRLEPFSVVCIYVEHAFVLQLHTVVIMVCDQCTYVYTYITCFWIMSGFITDDLHNCMFVNG